MTAQLIDGTAIAQKVRDEVKEKVEKESPRGNPSRGWRPCWSASGLTLRRTSA